MFYALTPLLLFARRWLFLLAVAGFAVKTALFHWSGFRAAYFPFWSEIGYFILGLWLYRFKDLLRLPKVATLGGLAAYMVLILSIDLAPYEGPYLWKHATVVGPLLLLMPSLFALPSGPADRWAGDLSYGLYVTHFIVINLIRGAGINPVGNIMAALAVIAISTAFALFFEVYAQRRIDAWRRQHFYRGSLRAAGRAVNTGVRPVLGHESRRVAVDDHA